MARYTAFARLGTHEGVAVINVYQQTPSGERRKVLILSPSEFYALTEQGVDIAEQIERERKEIADSDE